MHGPYLFRRASASSLNSPLYPHRREMQSSSSTSCASSDVAIFWDYENCHAPSSVSGYQVVSGIRNVAHKYGSVKYFKAYMEVPDANAYSRALSLRSELQSSGVSVTDCPHNGRKNVADQMVMVDMLAYAIDHPAPATIILISGDRDFAYAVAVLRLRRYEVVVISILAHSSLKNQASAWLDWNTHVLGCINSSPQHRCMEPSSPSTSSTVQQTPNTRRPSYSGESSYTSKFEQTKLSPVHSISEHPHLSQDQLEAVHAPAPVYAANHSAPRPDIVDPPRDTRPVNPLPPRNAPEAEPEQVHLASPIRLFSENPLTSEIDILPRPVSSPAVLDRPPSPDINSPGGTESTLLFTNLTLAQSPDHNVSTTVVSSPPPLAVGCSVGGDNIPLPKTVAAATPPFGGLSSEEIHNSSQKILHASAVPATSSNSLITKYQNFTTATGPPNLPLASSSTTNSVFTVPSLAFHPLIAVLEKYRTKGVMRPLRSTVGGELVKQYNTYTVYKYTGAQNFSQLTALAETAGIIELGGADGEAWISLCPANARAPVVTGPSAASSSTQAAANYQIPAAFQPLVDVLLRYTAKGVARPTRSIVAVELSKKIYSQAGVKTFKQFSILAEQARLVEMGGTQAGAWISLHRDFPLA